jgi:ribosome-binding protein aMBF1 (putative translation factor)
MASQTLTVAGRKFVLLPKREYEKLRTLARAAAEGDEPRLPRPDAQGNYPAVEFARASLARKIIRRRRAAGLSQAALARQAGIRPETLNRIERAKASADVGTVEKIVRALERAEAAATE